MPDAPRLNVVYAHYNTTDLLLRSIASVRRHADGVDVGIIVADDHSPESPAAALASAGGVTFIRADRNRGFGAANNLGARQATAEHLLLLNTDAFLCAETRLGDILRHLEAHPRVGALLPLLVDERGRPQETQVAHDPSVWRIVADKPVKLLMRLPLLRTLLRPLATRVNLDFAPRERSGPVPVAVAAALFVRRDVFQEIGGFDEDFVMFFEDSDLCRRIRRTGRTVEFHPGWRVIHLQGRSIASNREGRRLYFESQRRYFRKHGTAPGRLLIRLLQPVYIAAMRALGKGY